MGRVQCIQSIQEAALKKCQVLGVPHRPAIGKLPRLHILDPVCQTRIEFCTMADFNKAARVFQDLPGKTGRGFGKKQVR